MYMYRTLNQLQVHENMLTHWQCEFRLIIHSDNVVRDTSRTRGRLGGPQNGRSS